MSTTTTDRIDVSDEDYQDLAAHLRGVLIRPGDSGYDQNRKVYNGMIDKRPAAIARCRDVADVIRCVRFARDHALDIAVRGGGHNAGGLGVWDDALVIDLSLMRSTTVEPGRSTPSGSTAAAPGAMSTMRRSRSAWPPLPASSPPPGLAG